MVLFFGIGIPALLVLVGALYFWRKSVVEEREKREAMKRWVRR